MSALMQAAAAKSSRAPLHNAIAFKNELLRP